MNRPTKFLIASLSVVLTGCAIWTPETLPIAVELLPTPPTEIVSYALRQEEGKLIVSGGVASSEPLRAQDHVDLVVCTPDGQATGYYKAPVGDTSTRSNPFRNPGFSSQPARAITRGIPQREMGSFQASRNFKEMSFSAKVEPVPATGSTIRLRYDAPPFANMDRLECDTGKNNLTVPLGKSESGTGPK
jgi:hypothetical protein